MSNKQRIHLELLESEAALPRCGFGEPGHCLTCADETLPARVVRIDAETGLAVAAIGARMAEIDVSLVEAVTPGTWVLIHGGVAIARLEEANDDTDF